MDSRIWLSSPHMGGNETRYVNEAFESNWIAPLGPNVSAFEESIQSYLNSNKHIAVLCSGTAALHLGLVLLGVEKGDEVICQSKTFSASANPIVYLGATPIFVDSEMETYNLSPEMLENAIEDRINKGKKPKAIIAVHLYGMPYKVDKVNAIAKKYDIPVLEDSAESLGSKYKGQRCGTFGEISILSFNGNKIITTSGGGALVAKNQETKEKAVHLATQARDDKPEYHHTKIGYNYRMSNVLAGIGRGQMEVLEERVLLRREKFKNYKKELSKISDIQFLGEPDGHYSNRWLTTILVENVKVREELRLFLQAENIESRPLWKPMHMQPIFKDYPTYLNGNSEKLFNRGLCLPSGSNLTEKQQNKVIATINRYFSHV